MALYLGEDESKSKNLAVTENLVTDSRDWGTHLCGSLSYGSFAASF